MEIEKIQIKVRFNMHSIKKNLTKRYQIEENIYESL